MLIQFTNLFHFQRENNATTSWNLGEEVSFVELERPITEENMKNVEDICNNLIRENRNVTVEMLKTKDELRAGCKGKTKF